MPSSSSLFIRPAKSAIRKWRPKGSLSVFGNYPYYREYYARELKRHIDTHLLYPDGSINITQEIEYPLPASAHGPQRTTRVMRLNQAWKFLIDNLDDPETRIYSLLRDWTVISKEMECIAIRWKELVKRRHEVFMEQLKARTSPTEMPVPEEKKWKKDLEEFLMSAEENTILKKTGLQLSDTDLDYIETVVAGAGGSVKLIRLNYKSFVVAFSSTLD